MAEKSEMDFAEFLKGSIDSWQKAHKPAEVEEHAEAEPAKEAKKKEEPEIDVGKPYRKDGVTYIPLKAENVGDVAKMLNDTFHPTSHNSLKCTTCRPIIERTLAGEDFEVKEAKDGTITWVPKKK